MSTKDRRRGFPWWLLVPVVLVLVGWGWYSAFGEEDVHPETAVPEASNIDQRQAEALAEVSEGSSVSRYLVESSPLTGSRYADLETIGEWEASGDNVLEVAVDNPPAVINYFVETSSVGSSFKISVQGGDSRDYPKLGSKYWAWTMSYGDYQVLGSTGRYRIKVVSYGCDWCIKVGTELE